MEIGDIVSLKSGSQNMTVSRIGKAIECVYYNPITGKVETLSLHPETLRPAYSHPVPPADASRARSTSVATSSLSS